MRRGEVEWRASEATWDGYRDPKGPAPIELAGRFENGLQAWIHVLSFTERDALATHFVAKAEIRVDVEALLTWYERVRRPLPWRATRDPYALLVSEVMLQQTQALRVVPYYERWLARFPYAGGARGRARRATCWRCGAGSATTAARWRCSARPRSSPSTAGRPISRAAGRRAVHGGRGRLVRVGPAGRGGRHQRAARARAPRRRRAHAARAGARAAALLPPGRAATFNQAMMELGATVCRPRAPRCGACPVAARLPRAAAGGAAPARARSRFEDTDRWARGRVLAALLAGEEPPVHGERRERALAGLERDGLVVRGADGSCRLP